MIIGKDFNTKAKLLLSKIAESGDEERGKPVSVKPICKELKLDKTEAKNLLEYLESKSCLVLHSYGGPYLYDEVYLTKKGLHKSQKK